MNDRSVPRIAVDHTNDSGADSLAQLLNVPVDGNVSSLRRDRIAGVVVGTLVGFAEPDGIPLLTYPDQPGTAALPARATLQLLGTHVGSNVVIMFEEGDPYRPIIVGCLQAENARRLPSVAGQLEVDAEGDRLVVAAKERIVLRCGRASITLTKEGKLILQGAYVSSQSSGVLRIKGGSVQIN